MENLGIRILKPAVIVIGLALCSKPLLASGPWIDAAPPTLDFYLERLPAKSLGQIFVETAPRAQKEKEAQLDIDQVIARIGKEQPDQLIKDIDQLLEQARNEQAESEEFNKLHDLRDALTAAPQDAAEYIKWRLAHLPGKINAMDDEAADKVRESKIKLGEEIEKRAENSHTPIRANWYYLRGALAFNCGEKEEARAWFDRVVKEFPGHPRAEIALFMSARCSLSLSRFDSSEIDSSVREREKARKGFQEILDHYPKGRFAADALGWLGGVAWDSEADLQALNCYIRQAELPGHPELLKSSVLMTEKVLRRVAKSSDGEEAFTLISKHPRVAMGMLYLVLGSPDAAGNVVSDPEEPEPDVSQKLKEWRKAILPRLASAVAAQEKIYVQAPWMPRYLSILAHAASEAGRQKEAIQLADRISEKGDDLLFAKAIAQERAGMAREAIASFQLFLRKFPVSPLLSAARIRLAIALRDNHQSGEALLQLHQLVKDAKKSKPGSDDESSSYDSVYPPADSSLEITDSAIYRDISNAEMDQVKQIIDALLNFAPLEELEASAVSPENLMPSDWSAAIAQRALAQEDFARAKRFMVPAQYGLIASNLEELTAKAKAAKDPKQMAELQMRLGDAWAAARGQLLVYPLDAIEQKSIFHEEPYLAEVHRRKNGAVLGFHNLDAEMESREELRHSTRWWLSAARALPGTALSAAARLKVLNAMAQIAVTSDYTFERSKEAGLSKVSREIYNRLQSECPNSEEARKAAYLSISGSIQPSELWTAEEDFHGYRNRYSGYLWSDFSAFGDYDQEDDCHTGGELVELRGSSLDVSALAKEVSRRIGASQDIATSPLVINCLEDLALFLNEPGINAEIAHSYLNLRLDVAARSYGANCDLEVEGIAPEADPDQEVRNRIAKALQDPKMAGVRDYLEFLDAAMVANHAISIPTKDYDKGEPFSYTSRDYPALEKMMRDFLKRYPHSKKREAARLLLARAVFRLSWPRIESLGSLPIIGRYTPIQSTIKSYQREPFDPKRVLAELDAYDAEFKHGRYAADIRAMRASTLWRMGQWKPALELTLDQLDHSTPDLRRDAAYRLANLFAELANPEHRPEVIAVVKNNPAAIKRLSQYLQQAEGNRSHPLALLGAYLEDQLSFKVPPLEKRSE